MKKALAIVAALFTLGVSAYAQVFNHLSVGPSIGDGLGVEIAMPIGSHVQVRGGYSLSIPIPVNLDLSDMARDTDRDFSNVGVTFGTWKGGVGNLTFDFFPSAHRAFHFSAGILISSGKMLRVKADLTKVLRPDEYGTLGFGPEGKEVISSDPNGYAYLDWAANKVMPFIGLGWGRPCRQDRLVSVVFDMGVAYTGKTSFQSYNYIYNPERVVAINSAYFDNQDKGAIDIINGIPVMPTLKLTVFFRCF